MNSLLLVSSSSSGAGRRPARLVVAALAACLVAGCSVRRPYQTPAPPTVAAWTSSAGVESSVDTGAITRWWERFGDPQLSAYVERAVTGSPDIRTALSRLREARASVASSRSVLTPSVDASGSARFSGSDNVNQSYSLGLDASWEIDVFGGNQLAVDAATATAEARTFDLQDALVSLASEVAIDYIDVRSLQRRLAIASQNLSLQEETLSLTRFRVEAGLATEVDVQQALSNTESTRAQIVSLESQLARARHALAVLIGEPPAALDAELEATAEIPVAPIDVAVGVPAETIRRRPDVRSAERQYAAQFAQVDVARADLYPSFRLAGSIGLESLSIAKLLLPGAAFWSAAPSVNTRVFNRTQLRQNLVIQTERQEQAAQTYETRVLNALRDVEDALTSLTHETVRRDHLTAAAAAAEQSADLSLQLYTAGLRDFRDVLDAQRSLLSLQDSLVSSRATVSSELVRLYKALGGGLGAADFVPAEASGS
ncbi:MAG: hypothetical protein ABS36_13750 [Acidobacteria bacterium SCN 69-37]|nr:MAG: hypothetical protein ABS36_13750 [Acidobacteria bacterium SCN 69-37]